MEHFNHEFFSSISNSGPPVFDMILLTTLTVVSTGNLAVNVAGEIFGLNGLTRCTLHQGISLGLALNGTEGKSQKHQVARHFYVQLVQHFIYSCLLVIF